MQQQVIIIAEAGVNHNGDINLARQLIDIAAECGVDYVKFQTWVTEEVIDEEAPKAAYQKMNDGTATSQYEMLKKLELGFDDFIELRNYADSKHVKFISTPDEKTSLDFLVDKLGLSVIKVGSGEITNIPFLRQVARKKVDVILSTGMSTLGEVETALNTLVSYGSKSVALLHCTSNYPASYASANLRAMHTLHTAFKVPVGYSDHTDGIEVSLAAVAIGAVIIEKHYTIDKSMDGPDHKASLTPQELKDMVEQIRNVEQAISGSGIKEIQPEESANRGIMRKGLYLNQDVTEGTILTEDMFSFKRPVKDFPASSIDAVVGKKVIRNLHKGHSLGINDISYAC